MHYTIPRYLSKLRDSPPKITRRESPIAIARQRTDLFLRRNDMSVKDFLKSYKSDIKIQKFIASQANPRTDLSPYDEAMSKQIFDFVKGYALYKLYEDETDELFLKQIMSIQYEDAR